MIPCMHMMCMAMLDGLRRLTSKKYDAGGIFALSLDDPRLNELDDVPSTSDYIERFFGTASYLAKSNPHQSIEHRNLQLVMIEVDVADKLTAMWQADSTKGDMLLDNARRFRKEFIAAVRARKKATELEMLEVYHAALHDARTKAIATALAKTQQEQMAREWVHVPMEPPQAVAATGEDDLLCLVCKQYFGELTDFDFCPTCDTDSCLVNMITAAVEDSGARTGSEKEKAERTWLRVRLEMFRDVHGCHRVDDLTTVFFDGGNASILKNRTVEQLRGNLFLCSHYVAQKGSPLNSLDPNPPPVPVLSAPPGAPTAAISTS